jgi:GNAT superfamily N-acetyltransferase
MTEGQRMEKININLLKQNDIEGLSTAFSKDKPRQLFERYHSEQEVHHRAVFVGRSNNQIVGYVTLLLLPRYQPFREANIPEISDLNVLPEFRKKGFGAALVKQCESYASQNGYGVIGLGVGLTQDYGNAINLYVKNGYLPDGRGITSHCKPVSFGDRVVLDDDLVLWFTKSLKR